MKNNVRRMLPAFALLVSLASPFAAMAQVDDVYFVPSKNSEEKVLVIKSTAEKYNISTASASQGRDVDEYNRRFTAYTDSPDEYIDENYTGDYSYEEGAYEDYSYSTRIIRFRNPRRAMYSPIYWDLMYGCGVSDWLIYDNGYSIDIYPTYNNHLYFYSDFAFGWNPFSWYSWSSWHYPGCYGWYHPYHSPYYNHFYGHYHNNYPGHLMAGAGGGYWGTGRRSTRYVPTNGAVSGGGRSARGEGARSERGAVSASRADRGSMRADGNVRRERVASVDRGAGNNRLKSGVNGNSRGDRSVAQSRNERNESGAGFRIESNAGKTQGRDNAIRRQQPVRGSVNNGGNRGANGNVNAGVRQESSKGASGSSSVNRRESGASSGYNRPSSTSTVRSRSSSSSSSSSSVRSSSGSSSNSRSSSSYSSGSSSSRSSSSYGGSSGSSRSGSSFGGSSGSSRGSSSGGSRSGGRGR